MADGIFIKVLPKLELAALASVVTQLKTTMSKAGMEMSNSFDGPKRALDELNATVVSTSNAVAAATERMAALENEAARATERREAVQQKADNAHLKSLRDIAVAQQALNATLERSYPTQEAAALAIARAENTKWDAVARGENTANRNALALSAAADAEIAAHRRVGNQLDDLTGKRQAAIDAQAAHDAAMAKSATVMGQYGDALNIAGGASAAAFAVIGGTGLEAATKFETGMTRFQTAAMVPLDQIGKLQNGLLQLSSSMGVSMSDLQQASLMVSKSGLQYKDAATNLGLMHSAIELSKMEGADLTTTVQQLTTYMSDWNVSMDQAADTAAKLQRAAADAKRPLEEYLGALHNVEPTAMGMLDSKTGGPQILGLSSAMAQNGASMDQITDNFNNFITNLANPQSPQRGVLGSLGFDSNELSQQLKQPNGLITVLGELHEAVQKVTVGTGDNAKIRLPFGFNNPQVTKLMQQEYAQLSPAQKGIADQFVEAEQSGVPVSKDVRRYMMAAKSSGGMFSSWYDNFLKTTGPSQLVKQGIDPGNLSQAQIIRLLFGTQASVRSIAALWGDLGDKDDQHWSRAQNQVGIVGGETADKAGDLPYWGLLKSTPQQKIDELKASYHSMAIEIGESLLPVMKDFAETTTTVFNFLNGHKAVLDTITGALGVMATAWLAVKANMLFDKLFSAFATGCEMAIGKAGALKGAVTEVGVASTATATVVTETSATEVTALTTVETTAFKVRDAVNLIAGAAKGALLAFLVLKPYIDDWDKSLKDHKFDPSNDPNHVYGNSDGSMTPAQWESRASGDKAELDRRHNWIMQNIAPTLGPNQTLSDAMDQTFTAPWGASGRPDDLLGYLDTISKGGNGPHGSRGNTPPVGSILSTPGTPSGAPGGSGDVPTGTTSDPVTVKIPGFDPVSYAQSQMSGNGIDDGSDGFGDASSLSTLGVMNPLEQIKSGGFSLPNITKVLTTFLMELALGNPLGHLLTGTSMFGGDQQGDDVPERSLADIDKMTESQLKQALAEDRIKKAIGRYKKAQAAYLKAIASGKGIATAQENLIEAKLGIQDTVMSEQSSIDGAQDTYNSAYQVVQQDIKNNVQQLDPGKWQNDNARLQKAQNAIPGGGGGGSASPSGTNWDAIAQGESSGNWQTNTGNGYFGGLQFLQSTWDQFKDPDMPARADLATPEQQKAVAEKVLAAQGPGAWPNTYKLGAPGTSGSPGGPSWISPTHTPTGGGGAKFPQGLMPGLTPGGSPGAYSGGSLMPGANVTYTPDWMVQHGFPALYQRNAGNGKDATNIPAGIQQLARYFGMTVNSHSDSTLHGGDAGRGNTLDPMGGWAFDFYGNEQQMESLAQWAESPENIGNIAQLIHRGGGQDWGVAGGQNVGGPTGKGSYYNSGQGYSVHGDHDHIAFAQMPTIPGMPAGYTDPSTWGVGMPGGGQGFGNYPRFGGPGATGPSGAAGAGAAIAAGAGSPTPSNQAAPPMVGSGAGATFGGGFMGTAEGLINSAAGAAINAMAPGAGIAAQMAMQIGEQELNNVASYVGKAAGIGVSGLEETFGVHDPDGDSTGGKQGGWLAKIAGGLAGAHPQSQNSAGTAPQAKGGDQAGGAKANTDPATGGNTQNITINNHQVTDPVGAAAKTTQAMMQYPLPPS